MQGGSVFQGRSTPDRRVNRQTTPLPVVGLPPKHRRKLVNRGRRPILIGQVPTAIGYVQSIAQSIQPPLGV